MDLSNYIEELLYSNDCVIIPNIGGFIVNYNAARIDFVDQQIAPPNKQVAFNPKLVNNDGLVANFLMQKEHVNYKQAAQRVEEWALQIEQDLFNKKIIHFSKIGKLYFNTDSKLEFVPEQTNFLLDAYGMPAIACYPILRNKQYIKTEKIVTTPVKTTTREEVDAKAAAAKLTATANSTAVVTKKKENKKTILAAITLPRAIAVAAVILLLASSPSIIGSLFGNEENTTVLADKETPKKNIDNNSTDTHTVQQNAAASILPTIGGNSNDATTTEVEKEEPVDSVKKDLNQPVVEKTTNEKTETYVVVLGAFGKKKNATRLSKKLQKDNYMPVIDLSGSGLHRVGAQITCTKEEFNTHFQYIKDNYNKKAWLVE